MKNETVKTTTDVNALAISGLQAIENALGDLEFRYFHKRPIHQITINLIEDMEIDVGMLVERVRSESEPAPDRDYIVAFGGKCQLILDVINPEFTDDIAALKECIAIAEKYENHFPKP